MSVDPIYHASNIARKAHRISNAPQNTSEKNIFF